MLWWRLQQLKSANPKVRERAARKILRGGYSKGLENWNPTDNYHRALRAIALKHWKLATLVSSPDVIPLLPLIIEYTSEELYLDYYASMIEDFFASFQYEGALNVLLNALKSQSCIKGKLLSTEVIGHETKQELVGDGGANGMWEGIEIIEYDVIRYTYSPHFPVAEGAKKALLKLAEFQPKFNETISNAIKLYELSLTTRDKIIEMGTGSSESSSSRHIEVTYEDHEHR